MLRLNQLKKLAPALLGTIIAVVGLGAMTAANAQAEGGPVWLVNNLELNGGKTEADTSSGGVFVLSGTTNIECNKEQDAGEIIGTNPGLDLSAIEFLECHEQAAAKCLASNVSPDQINVSVQSVLTYPANEPETTGKAFDAILPNNSEENNNLFVEFTLKNETGTTACGLLNNLKVNVNAIGTLVNKFAKVDVINKKCGLLLEVGLLNGLAEFEIAKAGELALTGALNSTGTPEKATIWNPEAKVFEEIECKLEAFTAAALQLGVSDATLNSGLTSGWAV